MRVFLTRPAYSPLYQLITSKTKYKAVDFPLGLSYVAAALERGGHELEIVDGEANDLAPDQISNRIEVRQT